MNHIELRTKAHKYFKAQLDAAIAERDELGQYSVIEREDVERNKELYSSPNKDFWELLGKQARRDAITGFCEATDISLHQKVEDLWRILDEIRKAKIGVFEGLLEHDQSLQRYDFTNSNNVKLASETVRGAQATGLTLSEAIDAYFHEQRLTSGWAEATFIKKKAALDIAAELLGPDTSIASIGKLQAKGMKDILLELPVNRSKMPETRGLPLREAAAVPGMKTIKPETINGYISVYKNFWVWAEAHGHAPNILFDNIRVKNKNADNKSQPTAFSQEALISIYRELINPESTLVRKESHRWASLIAIFTGARQNEICQLDLNDVIKEDGIWLFNLTDEGDGNKRLKNNTSRRRVPIHSELIRLGLFEFYARRKERGQTRLFPDYDYCPKNGYGASLSKWFNRTFTKNLGVKSRAHVFHSFRHTMITRLGQAGVEHGHTQNIVGHNRPGVTQQVYMREGYTMQQLQHAIEHFSVE